MTTAPVSTTTTADLADPRSLRDDLRRALGQERPAGLQPLVDGGWHVVIGGGAHEPPLRLVPERVTARTALTAIVLTAVQDQTWHRLRACPDCSWAFYDSSRNARRQWCSMTAAGGARGCGSIAGTKAYRQRERTSTAPLTVPRWRARRPAPLGSGAPRPPRAPDGACG